MRSAQDSEKHGVNAFAIPAEDGLEPAERGGIRVDTAVEHRRIMITEKNPRLK